MWFQGVEKEEGQEDIKKKRKKKETLTIASVIPRHIPDPPPVQKTTFPLKISGLKIAVDSTIGTS